MRVGIGYDVHRLAQGRPLVLCGVDVPFERGLVGWSDADVVAHAIIDALLGASAMGDIGGYFPQGDPAYEGASSIALLSKIGELMRKNGWRIGNIDVVVIAERPFLRNFIGQMRQNVGQALSIDERQVGIKATTTEGLGFTGREEGISAYAVAIVEQK
ncbi:2-C-methyl-D-erythritol 2,4-cyclodiphosphate synthase [Chloroflexota bacterium]